MMAAKTKYFAIDANGARHTRTTARTYTHMVVVCHNLERMRQSASSEAERKSHGKNFDYHAREAGPNPQFSNTPEQMAEHRRIAEMGRDHYIEICVLSGIERINKAGVGEYADQWRDFGWCGRLDLAQKLAAKWAHYGKVEILEAQAE
ncbi:hypothetical protein [Serratia marcescens]|uniref:hypothetical protein n=1 Tax=Serratia marcescens TaxID=615 RepID=UPI00148CDA00|nr:hypothetical protein [Serratia marcescens]